jgi:hypothetical protein
MQRMTGAKIYSSEREVAVLESGGKEDPRWGREYSIRRYEWTMLFTTWRRSRCEVLH